MEIKVNDKVVLMRGVHSGWRGKIATVKKLEQQNSCPALTVECEGTQLFVFNNEVEKVKEDTSL